MRFQSFGGERDRVPQMSLVIVAFLQNRFTNLWVLIDLFLSVDRIYFYIFTLVEVLSSMKS